MNSDFQPDSKTPPECQPAEPADGDVSTITQARLDAMVDGELSLDQQQVLLRELESRSGDWAADGWRPIQ